MPDFLAAFTFAVKIGAHAERFFRENNDLDLDQRIAFRSSKWMLEVIKSLGPQETLCTASSEDSLPRTLQSNRK